MIFYQYKETFEVLIDYSKIGEEDIKAVVKEAIMNLLHDNIYAHIRRLIAELPGHGVKCISKLQSHCANMNLVTKVGMI